MILQGTAYWRDLNILNISFLGNDVHRQKCFGNTGVEKQCSEIASI
jgi:hypothetical protein